MICLIALIVFGILGIFSVAYRKIALEAFDCVFRRITIRKCTSGLDKRLKSQITGRLMNKSPKIARFAYKNFELISWFFTIMFVISLIYTGIGGYNYYLYGNCNGPNEDSFCIFDPLGGNTKFSDIATNESYSIKPITKGDLTLNEVNLESFPKYDRNAENNILFIGCYACKYTREAYPTIKKITERDDVNFIFAHFPAKDNTKFISNILNCINEVDENKFIEFNEILFTSEEISLKSEIAILQVVEEIGLNKESIKQCSYSERIHNLTSSQISELQKTGIYGTPTIFINSEPVVGPKPSRVYTKLLK